MAVLGEKRGHQTAKPAPVEEILDPTLPIIDAHHHLRDRDGEKYLLPQFLEDAMTGHNIRATVAIETSAFCRIDGPIEMRSVGETEFFNGVAAMAASEIYGPIRVCAGIVGYANLRLCSSVQPVLEAHIRAGGDRLKGIRNIASWDAFDGLRNARVNLPKGLLLDPAFREGFAYLAPNHLTYDCWVYHPQLPELLDLARNFPGTTIIVNHVGGPLGIGPYAGKRAEIFSSWSAQMREMAKCPNIHVKLGGLGMPIIGFGFHEREAKPSSPELAEAWRPYIETCIEAFGVGRCMFESNFPPDRQSADYPIIWNAFKRITSGASATEKTALFSGTAAKVYRLDGIV